MILATRSSAKTFSFVGKQAGASIPTCSTENGGAKFRKKEWQRIGNQIDAVDRLFNRLTSSREIRLDIRTRVDNDDDAACV